MQEHHYYVDIEASVDELWQLFWARIPHTETGDVTIDILHPGDDDRRGPDPALHLPRAPLPPDRRQGPVLGVADRGEARRSRGSTTPSGGPLLSEAEGRTRLEDLGDGTTRVHFSETYHAFNPLLRALLEKRVHAFISKDNDRLIKESLETGVGYLRKAKAKAAAKAAVQAERRSRRRRVAEPRRPLRSNQSVCRRCAAELTPVALTYLGVTSVAALSTTDGGTVGTGRSACGGADRGTTPTTATSTSRPSSSPSATAPCGRRAASSPGCRPALRATARRHRSRRRGQSGIVSIWTADAGRRRSGGRRPRGRASPAASCSASVPATRRSCRTTPGRTRTMVEYLDALDALDDAGPARAAGARRPRARACSSWPRPAPPAPTPTSSRSSTRPAPARSSGPGRCWRPRWPSSSRPTASPARELARALRQHLPAACPTTRNNLRRFGFGDDDIEGGGSDRLIDAVIPWGDAETVAARRPRPPRRRRRPRVRPGRRRLGRIPAGRVPGAGARAARRLSRRHGGRSAPRGRLRQQPRQRPEGPAAVRHRVLLRRLHLGERPPVAAVGHEHGVVAEAVVPPGARCAIVPGSTPSAQTSVPSGKATSATVLKRARRSPPPSSQRAELAQQLGHVVGVGGVLAGVAGRVDAGRAASASTSRPVSSATAAVPVAATKRPRLQPGVVDAASSPSSTTSGTSAGRGSSSTGERGRQHGHDLLDLVGVGRRQHEAQRRRARPARSPARRRLGQHGRLQAGQLLDARLGQAEQACRARPG